MDHRRARKREGGFLRFTGSKGGSGVAQWLINLMPPHRVWVEAFLGRGVLSALKKPAELNIVIDLDAAAIADDFRLCQLALFRHLARVTEGDRGGVLRLLPLGEGDRGRQRGCFEIASREVQKKAAGLGAYRPLTP